MHAVGEGERWEVAGLDNSISAGSGGGVIWWEARSNARVHNFCGRFVRELTIRRSSSITKEINYFQSIRSAKPISC